MSDTPDQVMTVLGPVPASELGATMTHEHFLIDMTCYWQPPTGASQWVYVDAPVDIENLGLIRRNPLLNRDNCRLFDLDLAIEEAMEFRKLGGGTIVDVTPPDVGRDPRALQIAARMTGLNVVAGCGHYVHLAHPASLDGEPVESVAERLIRELTEGIDGTGVRPGIIGELGTSAPLHPRERKVLAAAARAQQATGVPITLHMNPPTRDGHEVLDVLEGAGADLSRVVAGHLDIVLGHLDLDLREGVDYQRSIAERGCWIEFDTCGNDAYFANSGYGSAWWCPSDRERARALALLFEAGFGERLLISQDVCHKYHLTRYGGFGYGHILRNFVQNLKDIGFGDRELDLLLVENPRRMLARAG